MEIAGKPEEHVKETIEKMLNILKENKKITILKKEVAPIKKHELESPANPKQKVEIFSSFADTELEFPDFDELMQFIYTFMPSSVEILEPSNLKIKQKDLENSINDLLGRLHEQSKMAMEYQALRQQIIEQHKSNQK